MPRPFLELTLEQFADLLLQFPWRRSVTDVHVHHTFRPNHADFAARPPIQAIEGMFRYHTEECHFADIAQHVTIDPRGAIWTGRNWNMAPASATGFNGNATAGPFMFEMIGDFDLGRDRWEGAQRETAIEVIARVQMRFGLPPDAFRCHNQMSTKSCPGSAISRREVLEAVIAAHHRLAAPGADRAAAAGVTTDRATVDRILQIFQVEPAGGVFATESELPEADMTLAEAEVSSGQRRTASRGGAADDLTADDFALLRRHVINLRMGALSSGGLFHTTPEDVQALFAEHLPRFLAERRQQDPDARLTLVFFAHGGLNEEAESLKNARDRVPFYLANQCYPIFFVWETGVKETLRDILGQIIGIGSGREARAISDITDPFLESQFRPAGFSMWASMKRSAELAFLPRQGGMFVVEQLVTFWQQHSAEMEIHAIGHSAGAIFHARFIAALCQQPSNPPVDVQSVHYLAPAITVPLFEETLKDLVGGRVKSLTQYTMARDFELADAVGPYRKSLLYLVSRSFEDQPEMPILGLEESLRRDPDMVRFFGLLGRQQRLAEILFSVVENGPSHSTIARTHGDFDNDRLTMAAVIRRILRVADDQPIVEFPQSAARTILGPRASIAPSGPATEQLDGVPSGRTRALLAALGGSSRAAPGFAAIVARLDEIERRLARLDGTAPM